MNDIEGVGCDMDGNSSFRMATVPGVDGGYVSVHVEHNAPLIAKSVACCHSMTSDSEKRVNLGGDS